MQPALNNAIFENLKCLEQGQFQEFCKSFLPLINPLYEGLESHGMTADGKTRKGTPDLIKTLSNGKQIAVQCSVTKVYWKLPKKRTDLSKSKPGLDIDKCIHHLENLEEIILCSNQRIPTNAPNAKARILEYAKRKTNVRVNPFSGSDILEVLASNLYNPSFEPVFKNFLPSFYQTFISPLPKRHLRWNELIKACSSQVENEIKSKIGAKYIPKLYVHREKEKVLDSFIISGTSALIGIYKSMQTIVETTFRRNQFYIIDLDLLDSHDDIFLASHDRKRKVRFFLNNLSTNLEEKKKMVKGKEPDPRRKALLDGIKSLEDQIHDMELLLNGLFLIIDRAGSGKTNMLCNIAARYCKILPTIFITGRIEIIDEFSIENYIKSKLDYYSETPFQRCIEEINLLTAENDSSFLVIIDAINESRDIFRLEKAIANLIDMNIDKNMKVIISCRDISWNFFKDDIWKNYFGKLDKDLYEFSEEEFEKALPLYFSYYQMDCDLIGDAREKCRQPLLLRFFCEAYGDPHSAEIIELKSISEIRLKELFDEYLRKKIDWISGKIKLRDNQLVLDYLFKIAHHMRVGHLKSLLSGDISKITGDSNIYSVDSVYTLILDEDIIIEERPIIGRLEKRVVFVYEEFMEYIMAKEIIRDLGWVGKDGKRIIPEVKSFITRYKKYGNLLGILEYLGIMMKEERNINILNALIKYGNEYGLVICKSIQKLSPSYLDYSMLFTLETLLTAMKSPSEEIGEAIIDILTKSGKDWGEEIIDLLSELILFNANSIFIPAMSKLIEMRTQKSLNRINEFLEYGIRKCTAEEDYYSEKLIITADIFANKEFKGGIPLLIEMSKAVNIDVVKEAIRALGMVGEENMIYPMIMMIPEIYRGTYRNTSKNYDFKYIIGELIEEIINSLESLLKRNVVGNNNLGNLARMILNHRGDADRILDIFSLSMENFISIPIEELQNYLYEAVPYPLASPQEVSTEKLIFDTTVRRVIGMLTPREERVVRMRFGIDERFEKPWSEIGKALSIGESGVRKIFKSALKKLRRPSISRILKPFYDDYRVGID